MTEQTKLIPKRRFKEFQNTHGWEQRRLGELGSVAMNKRIFKEQTATSGEVPFYKIGTFGGGPDAFISQELFEEYRAKYPYPEVGDILISASGSIGRTVEYTGKDEYFQDSNIVWLNHDERLDNSFLKHFYSIVKWQGLEGSTIKRLYNKNILETRISLPLLEEQKKIGDFFTQLDNLITLHQRKLEKAKALKSAYLTEMFPAEGERVPKRRFAGFTDAWEQRRLGDVLEKMYNGQTPSRFNDDNWNGDINWLSSGELNRGVVTETIEKITETGQKDANLRIVPKGTFVMAITGLEAAGTRGNCAILDIDTTLNQSCMALFPQLNVLDTRFLFQWYRKVGEEYGINYTQGTKQQSYNAELVKILPITLPKIEEQKKIGRFFVNLDNLITLHQRKLEKLQNIKQAYLNEMFV
ncbi:MAG TPA: restriction endonuclease subunit S [Candidatus Paenibacillus intestinavium]|nr:restriction endonuclease subunit S [Candidatus Paenibacillus intestinavium]